MTTRKPLRRMKPLILDYEPLFDGANLERFLSDLIRWTLSGRIQSRTASTCRGIVETWLHAEDLPEVLEKMKDIELRMTSLRTCYPEAFKNLPEDQSNTLPDHT